MTNNDIKFGTFNKKTHIYHQTDKDGTPLSSPKVFSDLVEAQTYFMPPELMVIFNECMTTLRWALVQDENSNNTKLKVTFDFGIKENVSDPKEQWAEQFNIRKKAVPGQPNAQGGFWRQTNFTDPASSEHLF
jgi:hypothetical protein|tara:strand:+ start:1912 stop:2307 length:396 start_codon:yes stop_codon:yes gene_type:complete